MALLDSDEEMVESVEDLELVGNARLGDSVGTLLVVVKEPEALVLEDVGLEDDEEDDEELEVVPETDLVRARRKSATIYLHMTDEQAETGNERKEVAICLDEPWAKRR
jgi:hypothetical protein